MASNIFSKVGIFSSILNIAFTKKSIPLTVHINVTNTCNLKCSYCYGTYDKRDTKDFTTEQLLALIDELKSLGTKIINLGAGEPLMRKDIEQVIDYIRKNGIECHMNTNGHLVPQRLSAVKKLNTLCISLDGDEQSHDLYKGKGSYRKVIEAIDLAKKNNINVHTSTMISKYNVHAIEHILDLAKEKKFFVQFLLPFFQSNQDFLASREDYKNALRKIIDYKKKGYPVFFSKQAHQYTLDWPDYNKKSIEAGAIKDFGRHIKCHAGKNMCIIDSDGKVYPCSQMIQMIPALSFVEHGFIRAWENIKDHSCKTCYAFICFNDYNMLLGLSPHVILNHIKNSFIEAGWRK
ncbi:MAG: radical SAM protein [Candidatus Omnitrophica bacterium]|jgi:MoaA/NifB/PqqE/SkfB family radical SAM enzyme|nr:radical SAM protein [Candidatus Omnitrophota bacterium]